MLPPETIYKLCKAIADAIDEASAQGVVCEYPAVVYLNGVPFAFRQSLQAYERRKSKADDSAEAKHP